MTVARPTARGVPVTRVLVTGGSGFIGGHFPRRFLLAWASPGDRDKLVTTLVEASVQDGWTLISRTSHRIGVETVRRRGRASFCVCSAVEPAYLHPAAYPILRTLPCTLIPIAWCALPLS